MSYAQSKLNITDKATIRIIEDLINLLVTKGTITLNELPQEAQNRLALRATARTEKAAEPIPPLPE